MSYFRWLLGYKNLLRCIEYSEKSAIYGLEYLSTGLNSRKTELFIQNDVLRREYINQTLNFIPALQINYDKILKVNRFNIYQSKLVIGDTSVQVEKTIDYILEMMSFSR